MEPAAAGYMALCYHWKEEINAAEWACLHAARAADARVRDVAVAADLVGRVDNHDAALVRLAEQARHLADHRRLAHAWAPLQGSRARQPDQASMQPCRAAFSLC